MGNRGISEILFLLFIAIQASTGWSQRIFPGTDFGIGALSHIRRED